MHTAHQLFYQVKHHWVRWISISTSLEVLSSIFFIFIFPVSLALTIESMSDEVVVEYGISVIASVFLFNWLIRALIFTPSHSIIVICDIHNTLCWKIWI